MALSYLYSMVLCELQFEGRQLLGVFITLSVCYSIVSDLFY